jgi:anti-sigma factor RsiW
VADPKPTPDDAEGSEGASEELTAYLDGELDPRAAESLATRLSLDPKLRAEAEALQRAWDILDILPRPQPSSAFATRTISQVIPVPGSISGAHTEALSGAVAPTMAVPAARRPGPGFWVGSAALIVAAAVGGYFVRGELAPAPKPVTPDPPLEDVTLMKNLRLYRHVDDMDYLQKLDSPELFGDESE